MMDGYSVQDAASVLGVPEGRVWELLARGVLSGTPEGDSMRVYLKAEPAPMARSAPREALPRSNGNGGSHSPDGEASAFRELLTEFRNLTERYGQALLALGEARGEVAGLRSRVELLEARLDLRLPASIDAAPVAWESPAASAPAASAPAPEPPAPARVEPVMPSPAPVRRSPRPRKARSTRAAVAGFAEALARAQDPNLADVGDALPAEQAGPEPTTVDLAPDDKTIPDEVVAEVAADPEVAAFAAGAESAEPEAPEPTYSAPMVEPDWFADGDFSWLDAADIEAHGKSDATMPAPAPATLAAELEADPSAEAELEAEPIEEAPFEAEFVAEPEVAVEVAPGPEVAAEVAPEPQITEQPAPEMAPEPQPEAAAAFEVLEPLEVVAADEDAVMWLAGAHDPGSEMEVDTVAPRAGISPAQPTWDPVRPTPLPAGDRGAPVAQAVAPPLAMTEEELAQLAHDEGWDDAEVAAIRAMISRPAPGAVQLPGAAELDDAMAALQAVPIRPDMAASARQWVKPATASGETSRYPDWAYEAEPALPAAPAARSPAVPRLAASDPNWLRRRRGPAASAYRRIRRLFSG